MAQKFNLLTGTFDLVENAILESDQFSPIVNQTSFTLSALPKGKVMMIVNGVQIPSTAISIVKKVVTYNSSENEGYELLNTDIIHFNYLK